MRGVLATLAATATALVVVLTPLAAGAQDLAPLSVVTTVGTDISYPQCDSLPATTPAFTVVGVNEGLPNTTNSCLAEELAWATSQGATSLYVNTADPGVKAASWWPTSNHTQHDAVAVKTPYGTCAHTTSRACAYVYGYSMAHDDLLHRGVANASSYRWWLDVETSNTWNGSSTVDRADLEGMTAAFTAAHASVGIYSTHAQFSAIIGTVPTSSRLANLQTWLSGSTSQGGAQAQCATAPLTPGGRVAMAQYTPLTLGTASLDEDILCLSLATAHPTVTGTAAPHHRLTAHSGSWTSGATLTYQWRRSGHAIAGATHSTYTPATRDLGHAITVRVSGKRAGYDLSTRTSTSVTVEKALSHTPSPTVTGTASVGHVLTAHAGTWKPAHVTLHYQWLRNGVAIAGATHRHHTVSAFDGGTKLTVTVRGTKHGYATTTKTSSSRSVALG